MALCCISNQRGIFIMGKQVKIEYDLFIDLYRLIVCDDVDEECYKRVKQELENKFQKLLNHELYSKYKDKTLTEEDREEARQQYLDSVGIHKDFRW